MRGVSFANEPADEGAGLLSVVCDDCGREVAEDRTREYIDRTGRVKVCPACFRLWQDNTREVLASGASQTFSMNMASLSTVAYIGPGDYGSMGSVAIDINQYRWVKPTGPREEKPLQPPVMEKPPERPTKRRIEL